MISPEQTVFLPLRYILDNIVLIHETLHWTKTSRQPSVFLKLDFAKAYNKVSWRVLFHAMRSMGIHEQFVGWVQLFFGNTTAVVNLNGNPGKEFKIENGVKQGCLLSPYIFLIVGEVLTHLIKKAETEGRLRDISLPGGRKQHSISQYADDTSFIVRGTKKFVDELDRLLGLFSKASGIKINWENTCAYWFDKYIHKPDWLAGFN